MDKTPEILAPAGGFPQLEAAVRSGADAVYLGGSSMNARCSAANFTDGQLAEAAAYCHIRGVKLYLTMNTLLFDSELAEAERLLSLACRIGIDGIIVQDIGLASYIGRRAPSMKLHASTQCSIQTVSGLKMLRRLGFRRAVVARELSGDELAGLAKASVMELEYFVHGALCMSVSGQCWLSAVIGQRSGNRGRCAQPCRLPFRDGGFMNCLSLKDSSLIRYIPELAATGIDSLKIEGRLKRPEYCAAVTDACVRARGWQEVTQADTDHLAAIFSRSGFTDGYYKGVGSARCGRRDMFGIRTKNDVEAADSAAFAKIHVLYKNERASVPVSMALSADGDNAVLTVTDGDGRTAVSEAVLPAVRDAGQSAGLNQSAGSKLRKTGGTPYFVTSLEASGSGLDRLTPSAAGELRRQALDALSEQRAAGCAVPMEGLPIEDGFCPGPHRRQYAPKLDLVLRSAAQLPDKLPEAVRFPYGRVFLPLETPAEAFAEAAGRLIEAGIEPAVECARGMFGQDENIIRLLREKKSLGASLCMAHNLGAVELALSEGLKCCGGFGLNITNTLSLGALRELGLTDAELSFELTCAQIKALGDDLPRAVLIYGRLPLMLTRTCPASLESGCRGLSIEHDRSGTGGTCFITDRLGKNFPVMCRSGCSELLNTLPLSMSGRLDEFPNVERFIARFTAESAAGTAAVIESIMLGRPVPSDCGVTRGLYARGVE